MSTTETPATSAEPKYNYCPRCRELWRADWMTRAEISTCPACDGPTVPVASRRPRAIPQPEHKVA